MIRVAGLHILNDPGKPRASGDDPTWVTGVGAEAR